MAPNPPFVDGDVPPSSKWNTGVYVYDRSTSAVDVTNTTTETSLYSKSITGGHMSTDRSLWIHLRGDALVNVGAVTFTLRCKFGGTTWFGDATTSLSTSATRREWDIWLHIQNLGATNSQKAWGRILATAPTAGSVAGIGDLAQPGGASALMSVNNAGTFAQFSANGTLTIDTTANQTVDVTVQWDTASASASFRKQLGETFLC